MTSVSVDVSASTPADFSGQPLPERVVLKGPHRGFALLEAAGRPIPVTGEAVFDEVGVFLGAGSQVSDDLMRPPAGAGGRRVRRHRGQGAVSASRSPLVLVLGIPVPLSGYRPVTGYPLVAGDALASWWSRSLIASQQRRTSPATAHRWIRVVMVSGTERTASQRQGVLLRLRR